MSSGASDAMQARPDVAALHAYLDPLVPGGLDDLEVELVSGGRSNPIYRLTDGRRQWILRRPPYGHVLPTAHDMGRENRVHSALADTAVPVARTIVLCEDETVIDAPFYVMEMIYGITLRDSEETSRLTPDQRRRLSQSMVDTLVALHEVDPDAIGLADWGRSEGYLERQLRRWRKQWDASAPMPRPELDDLTWYLVFADFKVGVILEGIHARHRQGQTVGEGFDDVGEMAGALLERAHARARARLEPSPASPPRE